MSEEQHNKHGQAAAPGGAVFVCASCGHTQALPENLSGRKARCPKCGTPGMVGGSPAPEPGIDDVKLDDLVAEVGAGPQPEQAFMPQAPAGGVALEPEQGGRAPAAHLRRLFCVDPLANLLAGLLGGGHLLLGCLALAMLALLPGFGAMLSGHALVLTLAPAVFCTLLFALQGRLPVALGGPDPSAALCVFLLLSAVGGDMASRVPGPVSSATLLAVLPVATLASGALGLLLSRLQLAERVRFLPGEVLGGMIAGFGLLLVKAWFPVMAATDPSLAALGALSAEDFGPALVRTAPAWGPAAGFGLLLFFVRLATRSLVWPLLLAVLAVGAWNILALHPGLIPAWAAPAAALASAQRAVPGMLDLNSALGLLEPGRLQAVDWAALATRADFFAAVAAVAILPSLVRTSILESVLECDGEPDEQMRSVGAATMLSGLAGGLPGALSLSGSLGLRSLGASGPLAGLVAALCCLAVWLHGGPLLRHVPLFVPLGALLATGLAMPAGWVLGDARNPLSRKEDLRAAWASCLLVAVLGPVLGVFVTLGMGAMLGLSRAVSGGGVRLAQTGDVFRSNVDRSPTERRVLREQGGGILVLRLQGYLFLGTLYGVLAAVRSRLSAQPLRFLLLDFGAVTGLGASAAIGFRRLESLAARRGMLIYLTSVPLELEQHLEGLGYRMDDQAGVCRVALNLDYAMEFCEDALLAEAGALEQRLETLDRLLAASFPEPELVPVLMKCLERVAVPKNAVLIRQGDASDCMYFLESGKVRVELSLPGGRLLRLKKMGPGTVFGEMGIYTNAPRSASVIASEPCVAYRLSAERFALIQRKAPQLAAAVNRYVVALLAERVAEENAKNRAAQL